MRKPRFASGWFRVTRLLAAAILLLLLGIPSRAALAAPRGQGEPPAAVTLDLSGLQPYAAEIQDLAGVAVAGLPIALLVWLSTNAVVWVDLVKETNSTGKRRWALGSGIVLGMYASLHALAANSTMIAIAPLILCILDGVIRGVFAGIVAAFAYEAGSALLNRGKTP